jgi:hypothetical protein
MQTDKLKLELMSYGFAFLDELIKDGMILEYGELAVNLVHKYRLLNVSPERMHRLLDGHIHKIHNVCLYFHEQANNVCCLNLDNNYKVNNTSLIPEMKPAVALLRRHLREYSIEPLVVESGRGYHLWCRLDQAADNRRLFEFLLRIAAKTMASLKEDGHDYNRIKFNMYPNPQIVRIASLRLFGSEHIKNKIFSHVHLDDRILNERDSWDYFSRYLSEETITYKHFLEAHANLLAAIPPD